MMVCRRFLLTLVLLAGTTALPAATLTKDIRETTNPAVARPKVEAFVKAQVNDLATKDATGQHAAREALIAETMPGAPNPATPSAQFLDVYAEAVNAALDPLTKSTDVRVRLSAGIVASRVGEKTNNAKLVPVVVNLLNDERAPTVLWGIKASKSLMVPVLSGPNPDKNPLMPAFLAAVQKHIKVGPMVQAAYDAFKSGERVTQPPVLVSMAKAMHTIVQARQEQFVIGVPELPANETAAMAFLTRDNVWKAQSPQQQLQTIQLLSDLVSLAGQRVGSVQSAERAELATLLKQLGGALQVINTGNQKVTDAAKNLYSISPITNTEKMAEFAKALYPALKEFPAWKTLKAPPDAKPPAP